MNSNDTKPKSDKVGAVMVVGGGISGMQSALDLANSGFKVYLVEANPSIGGRMSQLDKTFPTNDCSMCMISPKLIEVSKHLNIELMTNTTVQAVEGEEGRFRVKLQTKPRYIDLSKCSSCGDCAKVCPVSVASEFECGLTTRKATFKRYPQAIPGAFSISKNARPPCKLTCPAGCNGQGYVALIGEGKYVEALDVIKQAIPLPGALGRICHHPCEFECNRGDVDEPIGIAPLKRFAADIVRKLRKEGSVPPEAKPVIDPAKPKVAVVGSGPSGLACASDLAKAGYPVTVFEASNAPGGQLQSSIPKYRLPKDGLAAEIQDIFDLGIELKLNTRLDSKNSVVALKTQGFKAVYMAVGAQGSRNLPIPGNDLPEVLLALDFLRDANVGKATRMGKRVVVVGGGNVAMDVARTARRMGATEVNAVCLESRKEMPAHVWEIEEAEEEGVVMNPSWGPKQILAEGGKVSAIEFEKCTAVFDKDKKFNPSFDKSVVKKFNCDTVIMAIGQAIDLSLLPKDTKIKTGRGGVVVVDPVTLATDEAGIFAGGDAVTGPKSAVEAIKHGHEAATSIIRYLTGANLREGRELPKPEAAPVPEGEHEQEARVKVKKIPLDKRVSTFDELEFCYSEEEARAEAKRCLDCGLCSECLQCVAACQAKAIDHTMKGKTTDIEVGSVIVASGFEPFDPTNLKGEYRYGVAKNVVTSLQFERILSASGPFQGTIQRPSDGKHPVKVAWIQCVGSRDETCGRDYCSSVCCMYATKQTIIAKEHDAHVQPTIFFNDMRAFGKGFERYYESAKDKYGVRYVRGLVSEIKELQKSNNLIMEYTGEDGKKTQEEFDMVVLSVGLVPTASTADLAKTLSIKLDRFGFCENKELEPNVTSRPGVYVAGSFESPMDIPESVMCGSSAACLASQGIAEARGTLVTEKKYPPEIDVTNQEPKVGVFICRCGSNIARVVDVPGVADYAKTLPYVVHAEENLYTCSTDTQVKIINAIKEKGINRVVVASCSPRTHEPLFQDSIREAGLNKYLFEMANIRDQCSWVHATHMPEATVKSKDLVRMAVARVVNLQPLYDSTAPVTRTGLIVGGGLAGMTAALEMASQGYDTVLVERETELGGNLRRLHYTLEGSDPQALLATLLKRISQEPRIKVYKGSRIKDFSGHVGNYKALIGTPGGDVTVELGVVIVATGATEYQPTEYLADKSDKVFTQVELEEKIAGRSAGVKDLKSVVMIQCVGSREKDHMYCSRVCCGQAVTNAIKLKDGNPGTEVYVLYRDIRTYGMKELKYREARDKGVIFIRFDENKKPEVTVDGGKLGVKVFDTVLGTNILMQPDMLVLSAAIRPQMDAGEFATKLKVPLTQDGFFMEAHMKLRPLDFVNDGMYLCGLAHSPKTIEESIMQARGAVSRALTVLSQPYLVVGGVISVVDPDRCVACLTCVRSCPFNVPAVNEKGVAYIEPSACQGCGICTSACPRKAITLRHYSDAQVMAKTSVLCSS